MSFFLKKNKLCFFSRQSLGFVSVSNSSGIALRGHGTVDCLDSGNGVYITGSSDIILDGWLVRYVHFWNTGIEHSEYVTLKNWKNLNALGSTHGNDNSVVFDHSRHILWDGGFTLSNDDASDNKADPENGWDLSGGVTASIYNITQRNLVLATHAGGLKIGWGATAKLMGSFTYEDIDIIDPCASINFIPSLTHIGHLTTIKDIIFKNVRLEGPGAKVSVGVQKGNAIVRNVTFVGLVAYEDSPSVVSIEGTSEDFDVEGVEFDSCEMGVSRTNFLPEFICARALPITPEVVSYGQGRPLTPSDEARFKTNRFASGISIVGAGGAGRTSSSQKNDDSQARRWVQDKFAISFFAQTHKPPIDEASFKLMRDGNFTAVGLFDHLGANKPDRAATALQQQLCAKYGLKCLLRLDNFKAAKNGTRTLPAASPSQWGFYLADEPNAHAFPSLAQDVASVRAAAPGEQPLLGVVVSLPLLTPSLAVVLRIGSMSFINLLPSNVSGEGHGDNASGWAHEWGAATWSACECAAAACLTRTSSRLLLGPDFARAFTCSA